MKKLLPFIIAIAMIGTLVSAFAAPAFAETAQQTGPDWLITEILVNSDGIGIGGWNSTSTIDCGEYLELYNNSGRELNLYDYGLAYNGNKIDNAKYNTQIVEFTPFKPGDYWDGTDLTGVSGVSTACKGENPEQCYVAPGECVVIWSRYWESYSTEVGNGNGFTIDNFRENYNIPEDVQVIMFDGNSETGHGGADKNFNLKNKDTGTYLVVKNTAFMQQANSETIEVESWASCEDVVSWVTVNFNGGLPLSASIGNMSITYGVTPDMVADTSANLQDLQPISYLSNPTPGYLDTATACGLYAVYARSGQTLSLNGDDFIGTGIIDENQTVTGYKIDGELHEGYTYDFAPVVDGFYKIEAVFGEVKQDETTKAPEETTAEPTQTTKDPETNAPTTNAPTTNAPTTDAPKEEGGCKSSLALSASAILVLCAGAVALKKKHD